MFPESVELKDFFHHNPSMVRFATPMNSNIIHEFNVVNSIDLYKILEGLFINKYA